MKRARVRVELTCLDCGANRVAGGTFIDAEEPGPRMKWAIERTGDAVLDVEQSLVDCCKKAMKDG